MKYLKSYQIFESPKYKKITDVINNMLVPLGMDIEYSENVKRTEFIVSLNPEITKHPDSILYNILDIVKPYPDMKLSDVCPEFETIIGYNHTEDRIPFYVSTNPRNTTDNFTHISANLNNFYHKLMDNIRYAFEHSTGNFSFDSTTMIPGGPFTQSYPFLKNLIIEYIHYLLKLEINIRF